MLLGATVSWVTGPFSERLGLHVLFLVILFASVLSQFAGAFNLP
jgi:hypothetical protein